MGLQTFLKTTGGKGLHVVVPIENAPWDEVKAFTRSVATTVAADSPGRYVATASKKERTGRIFVDYLRNSREATAIGAYSTRARPGATVSVPIAWDELGTLKTPNQYTVANLPQRLARLRRDPWADIGKVKQRLPARGPALASCWLALRLQRSLPPCGGGTGRGVTANSEFANTPLPNPPPQGGHKGGGSTRPCPPYITTLRMRAVRRLRTAPPPGREVALMVKRFWRRRIALSGSRTSPRREP